MVYLLSLGILCNGISVFTGGTISRYLCCHWGYYVISVLTVQTRCLNPVLICDTMKWCLCSNWRYHIRYLRSHLVYYLMVSLFSLGILFNGISVLTEIQCNGIYVLNRHIM